jgi:4-amino-4-deoxy-L-arabinose transferase-like glycosyltransferase
MQKHGTSLIFLTGGLLLVPAALQVHRSMPPGVKAPTPLFITAGAFMVLLALYAFLREGNAQRLESLLQRPAGWLQIQPWQIPLLICAVLFTILTHYAAWDTPSMPSPFIGWGAWLLAIVLVVIGSWQPGSRIPWPGRNTMRIALGLSLLACIVRGFAPESYPLLFSGDEGSGGLMGLYILYGDFNNPFTMGWFSFPGLYFFIPAASIKVFGPTLAALRIPSILAGSLTVGLTYLAGRTLFDKRVGLLAAFLLAGFPLHIHFSRMGLNNVWDGLFFVFVIGAAVYAWRHENRAAFIYAGLGLGFSQYFYVTSRGLLALIFLWFLLMGLLDRARFKRLLPDMTLMGTIILVITLPLAWFYFHHQNEFWAPFVRVNAFGEGLSSTSQAINTDLWEGIPEKIRVGLLSFMGLPIYNMWFPSEAPFLSMPIAAFFMAGLLFLLSRRYEGGNLLIGLWLLLFLFIGSFSDVSPPPQRYVVVAPACLLVAALGLSGITGILENRWPRITSISSSAIIVLGAALFTRGAVSYYTEFTPLSRAYYVAEPHGLIAQQLGRYLQKQPADTQVVFFGYPEMGYDSIPSLRYLAPHIEGMDVAGAWRDEDAPRPDSGHVVFVFLPANEDQIEFVREDYPGGQLYGEGTYWGRILYYYYVYQE